MSPAAIPNWNPQGVLPPINQSSPISMERSPYSVSLADFVSRFGTTPRRQTILSGFLYFRSALHSAGLTKGFQWVDGSFLENIEMIENRDPNDVDVVTFYHLPNGQTQKSFFQVHSSVFDQAHIKSINSVDAYFVHLKENSPESLINHATYWYSMWSHRRDALWRGYLKVDLNPGKDADAKANLEAMAKNGGVS